MRLDVGNAPTSWGIEKASDPTYPPWDQVLDEVAAAGYSGVELGPLGYFPADPGVLRSELERRDLRLSAGVIMEDLHEPATLGSLLSKVEQTCTILEPLGARRLVLIAGLTPSRVATAGNGAVADRLDRSGWCQLVESVSRMATVAADHGVVTAFHPHAGTPVEFADEIDRLLADTDPSLVTLCVDTGHALYAEVDPVALLADQGARVSHVHFKDVDPAVLAAARRDGLSFWDAYRRGIFCPLGRGAVPFPAVADELAAIGYEGWATVEQDASPTGDSVPVDDARASLSYLASVGLARP